MYLKQDYHEVVVASLDHSVFLGTEEIDNEIIIWLSASLDEALAIIHNVLGNLSQYGIEASVRKVESVHPRDWYAEWHESLKPIRVGKRYTIVAHPVQKLSVPESNVLILEPKMAFGTGHHPTTQLCIQLLEETVEIGQTWIDVGTGTGLLAIVAAKLGAEHVIAIDNDLWAIDNARENISINGCQAQIELFNTDVRAYSLPAAHGIVANLHLSLLIELADCFANVLPPGGKCICSGILSNQAKEVAGVYERMGFILRHQRSLDEWVAHLYELHR